MPHIPGKKIGGIWDPFEFLEKEPVAPERAGGGGASTAGFGFAAAAARSSALQQCSNAPIEDVT